MSLTSRPHLAVCTVLYSVLYAMLLVKTDGLPYVMDNNESFSSLWHARNLFEYGLSQSFGLADEAFGMHEAAHPYVHTHQGNFPRLFAFLIYALGARSVESQIVVTTFTVGLAAIVMIYAFFARIATPWFALAVSTVFMTDYVLFAQWHVVTYRVWHAFLLFAALLSVHQAVRTEGRQVWPVMLVFVCLFYYELVFAAFVGAFSFLFAIALTWRHPRRLVRIVLAQSAGAALALTVFFSQAIAYLGWDGFLRDIYITFMARNDYPDAFRLAEEGAAFYESRKVVFWFNIGDRGSFAGLDNFVRSLTNFDWRVHTPMLSLSIWVICGGLLLGFAKRREESAAHFPRYESMLAYSALFLGLWALIESVFPVDTVSRANGFLVAGILTALTAFMAWWTREGKPQANPTALARSLTVAGVLLAGAGLLFALRSRLFDASFQPVWAELRDTIGPPEVELVVFAASVMVAACFAIGGSARMMGDAGRSPLRSILGYLACGAGAYSIIYLLSPGYIFSGYLARHAPFTVFLTDVVVATALYSVARLAVHAFRSVRLSGPDAPRVAALRSYWGASLATVSTGLTVILLLYWCVIQISYVAWLPPTHYAFLKTLAAPPYRGASFVTDNYAAPVAAYTGEWAYYEQGVLRARIDREGAIKIPADRHHIWLADRDSNPQYQRPQYYLCLIPQSIDSVLARILRERGVPGYPGCSTRSLVRLARSAADGSTFALVARDGHGPSRIGFDSWAIVRLRSGQEADDRGIILDWSGRFALDRPVQSAD